MLDESGVGPMFLNKNQPEKNGLIRNAFPGSDWDFVYGFCLILRVQQKFWLVKLLQELFFLGFHLKKLIMLISIVGFA